MEFVPALCRDLHEWLSKDGENVAAIHCKAGKGRTGVMISCYLLHCQACPTARSVLEFFAQKRTQDGNVVTIPSQQRYVAYYKHLLTQSPQVNYKPRPLNLTMIRLDGHLIGHSKVTLQLTVRSPPSPEVVYTSSSIEWKQRNCASGNTGAATASPSTGAPSASSSNII